MEAHVTSSFRGRVARVFALVWLSVVVGMALVHLADGHHPASAATGDWPTYLHDASRTSANLDEATLSPANAGQLAPAWSLQTGGVVAASPSVAGGVVYVGSWDGNMYAIDATTGLEKWHTYLGQTTAPLCGPTSGITSSATIQNGVVYVGGGDSNWYALDAATGAILWSVFTGDNSQAGGHYNWSSPLIYNGFAYIGVASACDTPLVQGQLLRVSLTTHTVTNVFKVVPDGDVGGGIWASPTIDPAINTVFVVTGNEDPTPPLPEPYARAIVALDATTLTLKSAWQDPNGAGGNSDWGGTPVLFADKNGRTLVTANNKDGFVYAFDRANLTPGPVWQTQIAWGGPDPEGAGDGSIAPSAFDGTTLYAAGGRTTIGGVAYMGAVRALDPLTGHILWEQGALGIVLSALSYANGLVIDGAGPYLEVRSASNGAVLYSYTMGSVIYGAPTISNGRVFAGATTGKVYAFSLQPGNTPTPTPSISSGMSAYYAMESAAWNGTAGEVVDSSGNGYSGRSVGGATTADATPPIAGSPGTCRYATGFNGSTSYLSLGAPQLALGSQVTVMAWVRWGVDPATGNNWANIVSNNSGTVSDSGQFWLQHSQFNGNYEFAVETTSGRNWAQSAVAPVQGAWQHVAGVYDGSTLTIYVNGSVSGSAGLTGSVVAPSSGYQLDIGRWAFNSQTFRSFRGDIDEVRIYPRALSASEVVAAMSVTHACVAGTPTPTPTPSNTPTATATSTPGGATNTPTRTSTPSVTSTSTPSVTNTPTPTNTRTSTPTSTATPTGTVVPGGMSAYYAMESASWNGTANEVVDGSGSGFNGKSVGGVQTANVSPALAGDPGSCRYATAFNGSTSYLDLGTPAFNFPTGVTVMAWVRWGIAPGTGNSWANIVSNNSGTVSDSGQFWLQHSGVNSSFEFAVQTTSTRNWVQSSAAPVQGVWQHVAGVYDGSTLTIYVNGVLSGSASLTGNVVAPSSAYKLNIGRWAFNSEVFRSFRGDIDEVRIYPRALTAGEVGAAMSGTHACAAGTPTATPSNTPTATATGTPGGSTNTPTPTPSATNTPASTLTATPTSTPAGPTATPTSTPLPTPPPLAWYEMESVTWNGTPGEVVDSSGNGYSGKSVGSPTTSNTSPPIAGSPGTCRYGVFNGNSSYLALGQPQFTFADKLTVMAWVRWAIDPATGNNWANIVSNNSNLTSDHGQFWLQHSQFNANFEFAVETVNGRTWVQSTVAGVAGVWHHVAGVYDGAALTIYVDGVANASVGWSGAVIAPQADFNLDVARWAFNSELFRAFNGNIDEVRIYNAALSPSGIAAAMMATHPCP